MKREMKARLAAIAAGAMMVSGSALAAIDTTAVESKVAEGLVAIAAIGALVLGVHVAIKVWPWLRQAMGR